jgi:hypothetical protein
MTDRTAIDPPHPADPARPGEGPLFGAGSAFTPGAIRPRVLAREAPRAEAALRAVEARALESGWENPPLQSALAALPAGAREKLLLSADFRRWTTRVLRATHPDAPPDAALPVLVQSAWNLILVPWLAAPTAAQAAAPRSLWLMVYGDGTVPLPGSGLTLTETGGGRRVRLTLADQTWRFAAENGATLAEVARPALLAAAAGDAAARLPGPWRIAPRIDGGRIELTGAGAAARVSELESAMDTLAQAWPEGAELVRGLVRRIELTADPELRSKTVSELPGLVILGGWAAGPRPVAELLVHEAAHLLVYEVARLDRLLPAPEAMRRSPFSRAPARPAFMLLHGIVSFLAQAVTSARWPGAFAASTGDEPLNLGAELHRLLEGAKELTAHLAEHGAAPHPFIAALGAELALFRQWHARAGRA